MLSIVYWLIAKIGLLVDFALSVHILGNLSLLHFVIAFALLAMIISFLSFGHFSLFTFTNFGSLVNLRLSNIENKKDKSNYYHQTRSIKQGNATIYTKYRVNRKTGEMHEV